MAINQYLPSKEFQKRVYKIGLLLLLVVILRFGAYPLVQNLFDKNKIPENITVKQFVDIDTDSDGLPDWEESIWGTNPEKTDTNSDGISDFDFVTSKKQGLATTEQNETTILSTEIMQTIFALLNKDANSAQAIANLGDAAGQSIVNPQPTNKYTSSSFTVGGISKNEVKTYYTTFQKAYTTFAELKSKVKSPDEFELLSVAISSEDPDQLLDLDQTIKKYTAFETSLLAMKVPSDNMQTHVAFTNSIASIVSALTKSKQLYTNSVVGINGIIELRLAHTNLDTQIELLHSYFLRNGLIK